MASRDRQLIYADHLWRLRGRLGQPGLHVPAVQVLDRMRMQVQQLGHALVRHAPTHGADPLSEPVCIAGILRRPVQLRSLLPPDSANKSPAAAQMQVETPARCIGYPAPGACCGRRSFGGGSHSRNTPPFSFRRTNVSSRAWGTPKISCSRLRAQNLGKENNAESAWCVASVLLDNGRQASATDLGQDSSDRCPRSNPV